MSDISTIWNPSSATADWAMAESDLQSGNDLETAVLISLFTDRIANEDDVIPDGTNDPRGWWGDLTIGSRLWILDRAKQTQATLNQAKDIVTEALQWLVSDGVAAKFTVFTEWTRPQMLGIQVNIFKQDGSLIVLNYDWAWNF
jgi:phage gp46-like protein